MANEFKHKDPCTTLTQAEYIGADGTGHIFACQATGDILYASSATVLKNLGRGAANTVLHMGGSCIPAWTASPSVTDLTIGGGCITLTGAATDIDLIDNNASALSFDASGKTGIIDIVTTNCSEGVTMSGTLGVTGVLTATGGIELSHACQNTLTGSGGCLSIQGNVVYRAGGTDVPVADGGTGASSLTDGGVLLGSGTSAVTAMAVLADGEMIVGDGTTDPVAESGATLRTSIGVGTGDSPQFTDLTLTGGCITITNAATDIDLIDNNASALSFDASGKTGIIDIVTTDCSEGVTMSGTLGVTGVLTATGGIELSHATANTLTASSGVLSIEGNVVYSAGGTDVALADGGTGASLSDPGADRILFWDDSAGAIAFLVPNCNLAISGTNLNASGGGGTTINNATANEIVTVGACTSELCAEANLTFTGSLLTVTGNLALTNTDGGSSITRSTGETTGLNSPFVLTATSTGNAANTFGPAIEYKISDCGVGATRLGVIGIERNGADNTGQFKVNLDSGGTLATRFAVNASGQALHTAGTSGAPAISFACDTDTGIYSPACGKMVFVASCVDNKVHMDFGGGAGRVLLSDCANGFIDQGMTINQKCDDKQILSFKSSDVGHGMSSIADCDTYGFFQKGSAAGGGLQITGLTDTHASDHSAILLYGILGEAANDTKSLGDGFGIVRVRAAIKSGSGCTGPDTNANLFSIDESTNTRFIVDREGDVHYDGSTNASAWDEYCDVQLLTASRAVLMPECADFRKRFSGFVDDHAQTLHDTGVITLNDDGHHFISTKGLNGLMIDSIRQVHERVIGLETQLKALQGGCP